MHTGKWKTEMKIDLILVQSIRDAGADEVYELDDDFNRVLLESNDLRIAIELSTGVLIVLESGSRIKMTGDQLWIQRIHWTDED